MSNPRAKPPDATKHFTSSILLWVRTDQPRKTGMDHWKGPHSGIISASPGLEEYRQIHLADDNPGRWPGIDGIETSIPVDRKIDGVAEVTFESPLAPFAGRSQTKLAYRDEINVFRRTLLYAGLPQTSRWYQVGTPEATVGVRSLIYLRRKKATSGRTFRGVIQREVVPKLIGTAGLSELRTQAFLPWIKKMWDTPNVAHDNPDDQRFHASLILGFADDSARAQFFGSTGIDAFSRALAAVCSAIHAYDVETTVTYVSDGVIVRNGGG